MVKISKQITSLNHLLHNRFLLYLLLLVVIVDIVYLIDTRDYKSLTTLLIIGLLTTFFSKNMIVVLFLAITLTNVLKYGVHASNHYSNSMEGFTSDLDEGKLDEEPVSKKEIIKENDIGKDEKKVSKKDDHYEMLKKEYPEFKVIQQQILDSVDKMEPLLKKAEIFIDKFNKHAPSE
jgi:hypothetical protein